MKAQIAVFLACIALGASAPSSNQDSLNELCKIHGHGSTLVHPTDCTKFIQCVGEIANVLSCPSNLYFDITTISCEYDKAVCDHKAQGNSHHSTDDLSNHFSDHSSDSSNHQSKHPSNNLNNFDGMCNDKPNGALLPHPDDCGKFIQCVWGEPHEMICPEGLHFDAKKKVCNYPDEAGCGKSSNHKVIAVDTGKSLDDQCVGKPHGALVPHPEDCGKFIQCVGSVAYVQNCPSGLHFDAKRKVCNYPSEAKCEIKRVAAHSLTRAEDDDLEEACKGKPSGALVPHPHTCTQFLYCLSPPAVRDCPVGLHFNPTLKVCDWPTSAGCKSTSSSSSSGSSDKTKPADPSKPCYGKKDGTFLADPTDPTKFITCLKSDAYKLTCPSGLHFDEKTKSCSA